MTLNRPVLIGLVAACGAASPIAMQILVPVLPYIRADFQTSIDRTQWVITAFALALAGAMLVFGPLSDRFGRRRLLLAGLVVFTLGSAVCWRARSLELLVAGRVVQAIGAGAATTISRAIAADIFAGADLARIFAYLTMAIVVGPMLAPLAAGVMADQIGWPSIMLALGVFGLATTLLAGAGIPETRAPRGGVAGAPPSLGRELAGMLGDRRLLVYVAVLVTTQVGVYAFISASPYLIVELLGRSATEYGMFFIVITIGFLGGNFLSTRISHRLGSDRTIVVGLALFVLAWAALAGFVLSGQWTPVTLFGPATLLTLSNGLIQPNAHAAAITRASASKGAATSLTGFAQIMAGAAGLQLMAFAQADGGSPVAMVAVIGSAALSASLLALLLGRPFRRPGTPGAGSPGGLAP